MALTLQQDRSAKRASELDLARVITYIESAFFYRRVHSGRSSGTVGGFPRGITVMNDL